MCRQDQHGSILILPEKPDTRLAAQLRIVVVSARPAGFANLQRRVDQVTPHDCLAAVPAQANRHVPGRMAGQWHQPDLSVDDMIGLLTTADDVGTRITTDSETMRSTFEAVLEEQTYELRIVADQPLSFLAICTQTYGYRE